LQCQDEVAHRREAEPLEQGEAQGKPGRDVRGGAAAGEGAGMQWRNVMPEGARAERGL